jgi:hypothetical protein
MEVMNELWTEVSTRPGWSFNRRTSPEPEVMRDDRRFASIAIFTSLVLHLLLTCFMLRHETQS